MNAFKLLDIEKSISSYINMIEQLFYKHKYLDFFIDRSYVTSIFEDLIEDCKPYDVGYIQLAKTEDSQPNLIIVRVENIDILQKHIYDICTQILRQQDYAEQNFAVLGWGFSKQDISICAEILAYYSVAYETVVNDIDESTFKPMLFRWYDPRVLYILLHQLEDNLINTQLNVYEEWYFSHPKGLFRKNALAHTYPNLVHIEDKRFKFDQQASYLLDIYREVNVVNRILSQQDYPQENIDPLLTWLYLTEAKEILFKNSDSENRMSYATFCYLIHPKFMMHPNMQSVYKTSLSISLNEIIQSMTVVQIEKIKADLNK